MARKVYDAARERDIRLRMLDLVEEALPEMREIVLGQKQGAKASDQIAAYHNLVSATIGTKNTLESDADVQVTIVFA